MTKVVLKAGSEEWKDFMETNFKFPRHTLEYYGTHFGLEKADNEQNFKKINKMLNKCNGQREFLLRHIAMTRECFGAYKCEKHLSESHLRELIGYIKESKN